MKRLAIDVSSYPPGILYNSKLYFNCDDGANTGNEICVSDLTSVGTFSIANLNAGGSSSPNTFQIYNSKLFFSADAVATGSSLYSTDGTTVSIVSGTQNSNPLTPIILNNTLYFTCDFQGTTAREWCSYTGSSVTVMQDIYPGSTYSSIDFCTSLNNRLVFSHYNPTVGMELWITN